MTQRTHIWVIIGFAVIVVVLGGFGMAYKMTEFAATILKDEIAGFGAVALTTYFTGLLPLLFLTLWGIFSGHFRDVERPKYRMLELDRQIDARGNVIPRQ